MKQTLLRLSGAFVFAGAVLIVDLRLMGVGIKERPIEEVGQ